jgi:signal peptidase I
VEIWYNDSSINTGDLFLNDTELDILPIPETEEQSNDIVPQPVVEEEPDKQRGMLRFIFDVVETLVLSLILFAAVNFVTARIRVEGSSMLPSFQDGELVVVNKLAYSMGKPQRGDVIIFHYPRDPSMEYIKRIIGLSGDTVLVHDGKVFVNGQELKEPYINEPPDYEKLDVVPPGMLFVLGDNRRHSSDSHEWGVLPVDLVIGKAVFVYWPPQDIGEVKHYSLLSN